jgi:hypothetical protein
MQILYQQPICGFIFTYLDLSQVATVHTSRSFDPHKPVLSKPDCMGLAHLRNSMRTPRDVDPRKISHQFRCESGVSVI